jgi:3-phenylpropionate/cinnamic acid dioxygenase small subunit
MQLDELLAREAIRKTLATYNAAGDRLKAERFLSVFTDDAIFESEGVPEDELFRYVGKSEIAQWMHRWQHQTNDTTTPTHQASFVRHHLSTCDIELTLADQARVRTYWSAWTDIGPDHAGYYLDEFRKVGEHWLIAHRRVRLDWRSDRSLFGGAILRTQARAT